MDLGLAGRRVIVTGGTRGIGLATTRAFAAEGAAVAFSARGKEGVDAALEALSDVAGSVVGAAVDVGDHDGLRAWVEDVAGQLGGIDIVVSNATGASSKASVHESFENFLRVDLLGLVHLVDAALPYLRQSDAASIVSLSSTAAVENFGGGAVPYNAIKAGVVNYTAGLSQALARDGIRANVVSPGPIFVEGGSWDTIKQAKPEFFESTLGQLPMGRMGSPEEVARVITFIGSPAASWITGENIVVDGGFTKRVAY